MLSVADRWTQVTREMGLARQREPKTSVVSQTSQAMETEALSLKHGADFINAILRHENPELALPFSQWEKHQNFKILGLGPPPPEAYLFLYPNVEDSINKEYARRVHKSFVPVEFMRNGL
jgi:hypothetical protein